jgi:phage gp36-like protein
VAEYCSLVNLTERFGAHFLVALSDREDTRSETIDQALFAAAIARASAMIDGYLAVRYQLPLATVPEMLRGLCETIAIYEAHGVSAPEKITRDRDAAVKTLRDIASGAVRLDIAGAEPAATGAGTIETNGAERPFSPQTLKGYI